MKMSKMKKMMIFLNVSTIMFSIALTFAAFDVRFFLDGPGALFTLLAFPTAINLAERFFKWANGESILEVIIDEEQD